LKVAPTVTSAAKRMDNFIVILIEVLEAETM
jgi:hypothetical protein